MTQNNEGPIPKGAEDVYFLVVPMDSYKSLSDMATLKNMTVAQAFAMAISDFSSKSTEGLQAPSRPQLLTETR